MDNRTIEEVRENETKLIDEIKQLEKENKKYKEVINNAIDLINRDYVYDSNAFEGRTFQQDLLKILKEVEYE